MEYFKCDRANTESKVPRMKYRDVITFFVALGFILSLAYYFGVDSSIWYIPVILFVFLVIIVYKLWIEK